MHLIVGLGNPGKEYEQTRHNLGFRLLDLLHRQDFSSWKKKFDSVVASGAIGAQKIILAKPQTFMNDSGSSVAALVKYFQIPISQLIVAHDELDLMLGTVRVKVGGSSAGHRGVQSIIDALGTPDFRRVRIGMRTKLADQIEAEYFVLEKFSVADKEAVDSALQLALEKVLAVL